MPDKITTLKLVDNTDVFPNTKEENIPDTIMRIADLSKYVNSLTSININGDIDSTTITSDVATFTTADIGTLNVSGISQFEGKAVFGSDVEVDGGMTLNSPSDLHFKTGDTDFNEFKKKYYAEEGIAKYAGAFIPNFETAYIFADLVNYTDCDFMFSNALIGGGGVFKVPDFGKTTARFMFASIAGRNYFNDADYPFKISLGNIDCTDGYGMFLASKNCTQIDVQTGKTAKISGAFTYAFRLSQSLVSIGEIDVSGVTTFNMAFEGCKSLKSIHMKHFKFSFNISASTAFETADLVEIISNLDPVTTPQTLTMGATNLAKLTQEQILVGTGKGWTIA